MKTTNHLLRTGLRLEYATLTWNLFSFVPLILLSRQQHLVSLFGFGIDTFIEIFASMVVIWQLKDLSGCGEKLAVRLIGLSFFILATYLVIQAVSGWGNSPAARPSGLAISWLALTALIMFLLALAKKELVMLYSTGYCLPNPRYFN